MKRHIEKLREIGLFLGKLDSPRNEQKLVIWHPQRQPRQFHPPASSYILVLLL